MTLSPEQPTSDGALHEETQRRAALVPRTLLIVLIPVGTALITLIISQFMLGDAARPPGAGAPGDFGPLPLLVVLSVFGSALIILARLGRPTISALVLIGAWTFITTVGSLRFGVATYFPALLIIPICAAGLLIDRVACLSLAGLASVLIIGTSWIDAAGLSPSPPETFRPPAELLRYVAVGFWLGLFWAVAALTALLAGGLQLALKESRTRAEALRQLSDQLEARVDEQTRRLLHREREAATLEERTRLAREIHDTLAQGLTGVVVQLGAAQRAAAASPESAQQHLTMAQQLAREALAEARRSVWNLRSPALDHGSLEDALRGITERLQTAELATSYAQVGEPWPLPADVEAALLRVCQEALANSTRHSGARHVGVQLGYTPEAVILTIHDDGAGFPPQVLAEANSPGPAGGFGLRGMRERLAALGGQLELSNGSGARVVARIPRQGSV